MDCATIAASFVSDPKQLKVADVIAVAQSPVAVTSRDANCLWAWSLAIPAGTKQADASFSSPEALFWAKLSAVSTLACAPS
ncbi:hypothetical protein [Maritalea sp.]|uniref:hypothetical protein n=1 Tax=Maritalea sp. TaxID=2003361 RepID=UPI003EF301A9